MVVDNKDVGQSPAPSAIVTHSITAATSIQLETLDENLKELDKDKLGNKQYIKK